MHLTLLSLQGHIGLDTAVWPEGTPGCALDTLARTPLWSLGLNYRQACSLLTFVLPAMHLNTLARTPLWSLGLNYRQASGRLEL